MIDVVIYRPGSRRVLRDGERLRVPAQFADALPAAVAGLKLRSTPGFVIDASDDDPRLAAYDRYHSRLNDAWRNPQPVLDLEPIAVRDRATGKLPPGVTVYDAYDANISERWRNAASVT